MTTLDIIFIVFILITYEGLCLDKAYISYFINKTSIFIQNIGAETKSHFGDSLFELFIFWF